MSTQEITNFAELRVAAEVYAAWVAGDDASMLPQPPVNPHQTEELREAWECGLRGRRLPERLGGVADVCPAMPPEIERFWRGTEDVNRPVIPEPQQLIDADWRLGWE